MMMKSLHLLVQLSQKYLPGEYSSLLCYASKNITILFQNMVKSINSDKEIAKTRKQLSKLTIRMKEPIFLEPTRPVEGKRGPRTKKGDNVKQEEEWLLLEYVWMCV